MVEMALVMMLLAVMLFAIIQYGFIFAAHITVRNASAVGARQAAILNRPFAEAQDTARQAVGPMLNPALATATATVFTVTTTNDAVKMTVSYPLTLIIPFVVPGGGATRTLSATTVMK